METKIENRLDFGDILGIGLLVVVTAIGLAYGADIVSDVRDDQVTDAANCNSTSKANCGYDYNISSQGLTSMDDLASRMPTIIVIVVAAVLIGILIKHLWVTRGGGGV